MRKFLAFLLLFSIILSSCSKKEEIVTSEKNLKSVKSVVLQNKPITEQLKLVGKVYGDKEVIVSSQISGVINAVLHNNGDNVLKDSILATIDTNSLVGVSYQNALTALNNSYNIYNYSKESISKDIDLAKLTLETAKINRQNIYSMTDKQLAISEKQLENIENNKENTVLSNEENLKGATLGVDISQKSYQIAQSNIDNFEKNSAETKKSLLDKKTSLLRNAISSIQSSYVNIEQGLTFSDNILGITEKNKLLNDSYEIYLGAKNTQQRIDTELSLKSLLKTYQDNLAYVKSLDEKLKNDLKTVDFYQNDSTYGSDLDNSLELITKTKKLLSDLNDILNNSIVSTSLPQTTIDANKASISLKQTAIIQSESAIIGLKNSLFDMNNTITSTLTSIETNKSSLNNALSVSKSQYDNSKQGLETLKANLKSATDNVSGSVDLTKEQLNSTIATIKNSRDQADNSVRMSETQLNSSLARLDSQLVQTKSQLDATKGQKNLAGVSLKNSVIKAPFSSVVVSKMVEVGTLVNPGTPIFSLTSSDKLKIKMDMTLDNVSYISKDMSVKLELINGNTATGTVSLVSKNSDPKTNLFQVEISFDNNLLNAKIGEFVNIYVNKQISDKKGIMIPFESVLNVSDGVYNVFVISDSGAVSQRDVKLGIKNSLDVEIISGLKENERIAVSKVGDLENGEMVDFK